MHFLALKRLFIISNTVVITITTAFAGKQGFRSVPAVYVDNILLLRESAKLIFVSHNGLEMESVCSSYCGC